MIKIIWNWLAWKFYKGNATKLLAMSQEVVKVMHSRQKLAYALNAASLGVRIWKVHPNNYITPQALIWDVKQFVENPDMGVEVINHKGKVFKSIACGKLPKDFHPDFNTVANRELAYAFWSLTRMLAIVYPGHGFKLERGEKDCCTDSEALTRIATSAVASVAAAHGHDKGVRAYGKVYQAMIDHGKALLDGWPMGGLK